MVEGLTVEVLLKLHRAAILMYGGADGVLDEGTLHYLAERSLLHHDPVHEAAYLLHSIATMHPFYDGNKRTALMAADAVLGLHGRMLTASNDKAASFVLLVAQGKKTEEHVRKWIGRNSGIYRGY